MRAHMVVPCENCPYRMDAPTYHWSRLEFEGVLAAEADVIGKVFSCHKHKDLAPDEQGMCAGWLLDQKKRGCPSIALRLSFNLDPDAIQAIEAVNAQGLKLYPSVLAMCRANGVRPKRKSSHG